MNGESSKTDSATKVSDKPPVIHRPLLPRQTAITTQAVESPRSASSALSSGTSTAPRKTSFAELVRNFKAAKKAKTAAPAHQETVELDDPLDAILNEDFSEILSPGPGSSSINRTNDPDASTEPGPSKRNVVEIVKQTKTSTFFRADQCSDLDPAVPTGSNPLNPLSEKTEDSYTSERIDNDRHNTPVTKMYAKFDSLSEHQENSESISETVPTFTPYINTQSVGLMSSAKENLAPPPHFNLSPIVVEPIGCHGDVISSVDDVTKEELSAKTSRPPETSLFHDRTAEKLKRFSYQSKGK